VGELKKQGKYPVYFFKSDTTGEKDFEEFYTDREVLDMDRFASIGVIKNEPVYDERKLEYFTEAVCVFREKGKWSRAELIEVFNQMMPAFRHKETGKFLDGKM
jgi:hypothetical protein